MKKILCVLMVLTMLVGTCAITVSADVSTEDEADQWLFYQKFSDRFAFPEDGDPVLRYEELYYNYNAQGDVEWALIYGYTRGASLWIFKSCAVLEDRVVRDGRILTGPFCSNYGVYDVDKQDFLSLGDASQEEKYHDEIFAYLDENNIGEIIGDMDNDRKVTVKDATYIQKCIAGILEYPEDDVVCADFYYTESYGHIAYLSDFNRDDVRNIKDATMIQKYLADMIDIDDIHLVTVSANYESGMAMNNETVKFTVNAKSSLEPIRYDAFVDGRECASIRNRNTFDYTFSKAGEYLITIRAYNAFYGIDEYEMTYKVVERNSYKGKTPVIRALYYDKNYFAGDSEHIMNSLDENITITAEAIYGNGDYEYCFLINGEVVQDFSENNQYVLNKAEDGKNYEITALVRDSSTGEGYVSKTMTAKGAVVNR